jgi:hypothetical protein
MKISPFSFPIAKYFSYSSTAAAVIFGGFYFFFYKRYEVYRIPVLRFQIQII